MTRSGKPQPSVPAVTATPTWRPSDEQLRVIARLLVAIARRHQKRTDH
jgi:hypothetical protein